MKTFRIYCVVLACVVILAPANAAAAETLSEILRESKWDAIIGTWVDAETMGTNAKTTYAWKIEDKVIEITSRLGENRSVALMGVNGKTGEVFHMGADSDGNSSLGTWKVVDGDAVLGIAYTTGEGQEGVMSIRYHREDKDAVTMTIELPEPVTMSLVRVKDPLKQTK